MADTFESDDIQAEVNAAYAKGALPMMQLIAQRTAQASISLRAQYIYAGFTALDTPDVTQATQYFETLREITQPWEMAAHEQALDVVFNSVMTTVMKQAERKLDALAMVMGLDAKIEARIKSDLYEPQVSDDTEGAEPKPVFH